MKVYVFANMPGMVEDGQLLLTVEYHGVQAEHAQCLIDDLGRGEIKDAVSDFASRYTADPFRVVLQDELPAYAGLLDEVNGTEENLTANELQKALAAAVLAKAVDHLLAPVVTDLPDFIAP